MPLPALTAHHGTRFRTTIWFWRLARRPLLTFVIAGGGFAGVELAGAINDFAHGILADYPTLQPEDLSTILVHSQDRILPELSESLARYAQQRMEARGVT